MENGLVSIVMPTYNCASFVQRDIDSVNNQTYELWELIIVNDGSIDSTETICNSCAANEPRIKYISQENYGLSMARNAGLKHVTGDYVAFLDSDDWYEPNYLEMMIGKLQSTEADVVMCDFCIDGQSEFSYSDKVLDGKDILSEFIGGGICNRIMNKVYRTDVISGIFFPEGRNMMEDGVWTPHVLEKCRRLVIIGQPLYNYYVHQGSVSRRRRRSELEIVGFYKNLLERDQFVLEHAEQGVEANTVKKILKDLETVFDSCCNLALWNTRETAKDIVKNHYNILNTII